MSEVKPDGKKFMAALFLFSLLLRLMLSPLHINEPSMPFDFYSYTASGECFIDAVRGQRECLQTLDSEFQNRYGPMFNLIMAVWIYLFGPNFLLLKLPGILFDSITPVLIYLIALRLSKRDDAVYSALLYSTSYLTLLSAGLWGNDDSFFMPFAFASVLLVLKGRNGWGLFSLAIACLFKSAPLVLLLPFLAFFYRNGGWRASLKYATVFSFLLCLLYSPYLYLAGRMALIPFTAPLSWGVEGLSPLNLVKLTYALPYHVLHPELPRSFSSRDPKDPWNLQGDTLFARVLRSITLPFSLAGILMYGFYVLKFRLEKKELDLVRNIVLVFMVFLFFSKVIYSAYYLWFLPFLFILYSRRSGFAGVTRVTAFGFLLILLALVVYGVRFRASDAILPWYDLALMYLCVALATFGTHLTFTHLRGPARACMLFFVLIFMLDSFVTAKLPMLFYPLVSGVITYELARRVAYYGMWYILILMNVAAFIWLFVVIHRTRD